MDRRTIPPQGCRPKNVSSGRRGSVDSDDDEFDSVDGSAPRSLVRWPVRHHVAGLGKRLPGNDGDDMRATPFDVDRTQTRYTDGGDTVDGAAHGIRMGLVSHAQPASYSKDGSSIYIKQNHTDKRIIDKNPWRASSLVPTLFENELGSPTECVKSTKEWSALKAELDKLVESNKTLKERVDEKLKKLTQVENEKEDLEQKYICSVDLENPVSRAFLPCRHLVACHECAPKLKCCPLCREKITSIVHVDVKTTLKTPMRRRRPPPPKLASSNPTVSSEKDVSDVKPSSLSVSSEMLEKSIKPTPSALVPPERGNVHPASNESDTTISSGKDVSDVKPSSLSLSPEMLKKSNDNKPTSSTSAPPKKKKVPTATLR